LRAFPLILTFSRREKEQPLDRYLRVTGGGAEFRLRAIEWKGVFKLRVMVEPVALRQTLPVQRAL